tara:strand:- start:137 stop:958 length:822 start_codon:yes stop_codon:yes gene_type:complete
MKKMRIVIITVSLFLFTGMSIISVDLFTKSQIDVIADDVFALYTEGDVDVAYGKIEIDGYIRMNNNFWYATANKCECNENELNFTLLALLNINPTHTGRHYVHYRSGKQYSWSWQEPLYNNPEILSKALEKYGYYFIRNIDAKFNYVKKNKINVNDCIECLSSDIFWGKTINMINEYQFLIQKLLSIDDKELNYYFMTYTSNEGMLDLNVWLESHDIKPVKDYFGGYSGFPHDYLSLVERTSVSSSEWSPRRFLEQTQEFNIQVIELINERHQ